jgi:hypothetical protein
MVGGLHGDACPWARRSTMSDKVRGALAVGELEFARDSLGSTNAPNTKSGKRRRKGRKGSRRGTWRRGCNMTPLAKSQNNAQWHMLVKF